MAKILPLILILCNLSLGAQDYKIADSLEYYTLETAILGLTDQSQTLEECNTIRVVVHVIYDSMEGVGACDSHISEEQVYSQIRATNMLFRNDSLMYHEDNAGLPYRIELEEIIYYDGVELYGEMWHDEGLNSNSSAGVSAGTLSSDLAWGADENGKKYLNSYVVSRIDGGFAGGIQAFAYFPTVNPVYGNYNLYNTFGYEDLETDETFCLKNYTEKGKVWSHELLHNFAIFHTFQGNSCEPETNSAIQGDRVADTPPQTQGYGCTGSCGFLSENVMDYISENCKHIITEGQSFRANLAIQNSLQAYLVCSTCDTNPDLNGDGFINVQDVSLMNSVFGCSDGDLCYDPQYDLNCDGYINILDVSALSAGFNQDPLNDTYEPQIFDVTGREVDKMGRGVYIIKYNNGTVKKVFNGKE